MALGDPATKFILRRYGAINLRAFEFYSRLKKVKRYIDDNRDIQMSLSAAAKIAGMERTYFSKFFHEKVSMGFKCWLNLDRVQRAITLMMTGDHSLTAVAESTGFGSLSAFERQVKRFTGLTPREVKHRVEWQFSPRLSQSSEKSSQQTPRHSRRRHV